MRYPLARFAVLRLFVGLAVVAAIGFGVYFISGKKQYAHSVSSPPKHLNYQPRKTLDTSGYETVSRRLSKWPPNASLEEIGAAWKKTWEGSFVREDSPVFQSLSPSMKIQELISNAALHNYQGESPKAYECLRKARAIAEEDDELAEEWLFTIIYFQGVSALRRGEDDNCILCRGESSCILPLAPSAIHTNPMGSQAAIDHFKDYLKQFPDDIQTRWLLNLAHMTLGEYPRQVDTKYLITLDPFMKSEFDIGRFRDIGHIVGVNRYNQAGGAIMEDFDNDGYLDIVTTSFDPNQSMAFFRNKGDGTFENRTQAAGLANQIGGLNCIQTDYNNDGFVDILVLRGAWVGGPIRPSLLRNN